MNKLKELVNDGIISSCELCYLDENGKVGYSEIRSSQRLIMNFPNGKVLTIDTFCPRNLENTALRIS